MTDTRQALAAIVDRDFTFFDGRVRRFPSLAEARDEAQKRFAPVVFRRS